MDRKDRVLERLIDVYKELGPIVQISWDNFVFGAVAVLEAAQEYIPRFDKDYICKGLKR